MIAALRDFERLCVALARRAIDQPVFDVDAAGPPAGEIAAKGFGLAGAREEMAPAFLEQDVLAGELIVSIATACQPDAAAPLLRFKTRGL